MADTVVVVGGDARDAWLARIIQSQGFMVVTRGCHFDGIPQESSRTTAAPKMFIGPITGIGPEGEMQALDGQTRISPEDMARMGPQAILAAGLIAPPVKDWAARYHLRLVEYRNESSFMWLNAVPTAEGAIHAAMGRSGHLLYRRPLGILGFGRVGTVLALRLLGYGAWVTVFERSREKRAMARALGLSAQGLDPAESAGLDGLFNTIPGPVIDREWLRHSDPAWIIDLASLPGGLVPDARADRAVSTRYQSILGIPGQIAPRRAAEIVWETLQLALTE